MELKFTENTNIFLKHDSNHEFNSNTLDREKEKYTIERNGFKRRNKSSAKLKLEWGQKII